MTTQSVVPRLNIIQARQPDAPLPTQSNSWGAGVRLLPSSRGQRQRKTTTASTQLPGLAGPAASHWVDPVDPAGSIGDNAAHGAPACTITFVPNALRRTTCYITLYEKARLIAMREKELTKGSLARVKVTPQIASSTVMIAFEEYIQRKIPLDLVRVMPNGDYELWRQHELVDTEVDHSVEWEQAPEGSPTEGSDTGADLVPSSLLQLSEQLQEGARDPFDLLKRPQGKADLTRLQRLTAIHVNRGWANPL
jgi:DNA-directed RNA polymerase subunit K/omega